MCHVFPPHVSRFGLFPVLVSCHYELSMFQLCLSRYVLIIPCILVLSFEFDFVWSTRYFPVYPVSESCLNVLIKYCYLSLHPRLRVPVPPSCVHLDTYTEYSLFLFRYIDYIYVMCVCVYTHTHTHCRSKDFLLFFNVIYFSDANQNFHQPFSPVFSVTKSFRNHSNMFIYYQCCSFIKNPEQNVTGSIKY